MRSWRMPSIPIVGEGNAQPNDTYVEQLVAGAKAAIDAGAALGVVDSKRVAVMGHSYGAFMTANLLAHCDMFRAGIARSGAYNRTLTPFGFQAEERTYWKRRNFITKCRHSVMPTRSRHPSCSFTAKRTTIKALFQFSLNALMWRSRGMAPRFASFFLPLEAHGYEAHESLSHMFWEMNRWLDFT